MQAEVKDGRRTAGADLAGLLRPVRQGNAFEETVERLLTVIKLGMIAPGDRFPAERELAAQLGISRLTLREALAELHKAGYVSPRRGRLGDGLVASAWTEDGTVEAVEFAAPEPFALGVQWHPEEGADPRPFTALVAAARKYHERQAAR